MAKDVGKGFDRLAGSYDLLVRLVYGNSLQQAQSALLPALPQGRDVLLIGGGTGRLLKPLCLEAKPRHILYIDASAVMLQRAQAFVKKEIPSWENKISFLQGTQELLPDAGQFDVVITPFFLDLFSEEAFEAVFDRLALQLKPEGSWYLIDFQEAKGIFSVPSKILIWAMYRFFRLATGISGDRLIDPTPYFRRNRFSLQAEKLFYQGMVKSQLWKKESL